LDSVIVAAVALFSPAALTTNATGGDPLQSYRTNRMGQMNPNVAMFLSFGAVALFSFLSVGAWVGARAMERKAFYRNEMLKKLAEAGPAAVTEYLREEERADERRRMEDRDKEIEGFRFVGLILLVVGVTIGIAFHQIVRNLPIYLFGLLPAGIGLVFLANATFIARRR
jgi:hypothetical protein